MRIAVFRVFLNGIEKLDHGLRIFLLFVVFLATVKEILRRDRGFPDGICQHASHKDGCGQDGREDYFFHRSASRVTEKKEGDARLTGLSSLCLSDLTNIARMGYINRSARRKKTMPPS